MNKKSLLLVTLLSINSLSLFSCGNNVTKNTVNYRIGYDSKNKTCQIIIPSDFNYEELTIDSYKYIKNDNFEGNCKVVRLYVNSNENNFFLKDNKFIKKVTIKSEYISTFGYDIFRNSSVEYVDLSLAKGLTKIGDHVFAYTPIKSIKMPPNLEMLYKGVFYNSDVKEVIFTDALKEIGINTFFNTKHLTKVDFGYNLSKISASSFENSSICNVIGNNVTYVDDYAFKNATNLETIKFSSLNYVGKEAFLNTNIKEISLENCTIKVDAFRGSKINKVDMNNCSVIEYGAFKDCKSLKEITIKGNTRLIKSNAFKNTSIESIILPDSLTAIESEAFSSCTSLKEVKLSSSLEVISSSAFLNCSSLKEIEFPSSIKRIYPGAFINTALTKVTLPKSVEILGEAFPSNCEIVYY